MCMEWQRGERDSTKHVLINDIYIWFFRHQRCVWVSDSQTGMYCMHKSGASGSLILLVWLHQQSCTPVKRA